MNPLSEQDIEEGLRVRCMICKAPAGVDCRNSITGKKLGYSRIHYARVELRR